jgi:L-asparaginase II
MGPRHKAGDDMLEQVVGSMGTPISNPILVEVTRGGIVESRHGGAYAVGDAQGRVLAEAGDVTRPVFPRSAIKAFQCLPVIESGAAERFGFNDEEMALACASHGGEPAHVRVARAMLAKVGAAEGDYECGAHWPTDHEAQRGLVRAGGGPLAVHNNCSGKHAGMLALAKQLGVPAQGYSQREHPVQQTIASMIGELCDVDVDGAPCGIDGCSVPTWAVPLSNLALGFARMTRRASAKRIFAACRAHPFMVAGTERFCTRLMQAVPRAFVKTGAEGVYCAAVPHAGLGIALKCDDGAGRAAEVAMAAVLARLDVWTAPERAALQTFARVEIKNWRQFTTGDIRAAM